MADLEIRKLAGALGAEIFGVDLSKDAGRCTVSRRSTAPFSTIR